MEVNLTYSYRAIINLFQRVIIGSSDGVQFFGEKLTNIYIYI